MGWKEKCAAATLTSAGMLALVTLVAEDVRRVAPVDLHDGSPPLSAYELRLATWMDERLGAPAGCRGSGGQPRRARR